MLGKCLSGLTVLVLCALAPAAAGAAEAPVTLVPFQLEASNGFTILGLAGAEAGEEGEVLLIARDRRSVAAYRAPAAVTETTLDADLGKLGKISLTLVPTGRTRSVQVGCDRGDRERMKTVRYEGSFDFHGEEDFTEISTTRVAVYYRLLALFSCSGGDESFGSAGPRLPGARLEVDAHAGDLDLLELNVDKKRPGARTRIGVEVEEQRGEIMIERATGTWASADAFRFDPRLRRATVSPPAPFGGHATYRRGAKPENRWTGDLTVDLPGHSDFPLTGPGLEATMVHARR